MVPPSPLANHLADVLRSRADELVQDWLEWLQERGDLRIADVMPREAVLDHIPPVLVSVAEFLVSPVDAVRMELVGHLRVHAQVRRIQGFDIEQLVHEYRGLDHVISGAMLDALAAYEGEVDPLEVARLFVRLRDGLATITEVTADSYREQEAAQARELDERLQELADVLAHELRNPLHAVRISAGMLGLDAVADDPEKRRHYLELIDRRLKRLGELVDEVRMLSSTEAMRSYQEDWRVLSEVVGRVMAETRGLAASRGVRMELGELPSVQVPGSTVGIVLVNLVTNAIKYADPGKDDPMVHVSARHLASTDGVEPRLRVEVRDNGIGIAPSTGARIFQRRFREHPEHAEGTGLGLGIARTVLEQQGGQLQFDSEPGVGSTFWFELPCVPASTQVS